MSPRMSLRSRDSERAVIVIACCCQSEGSLTISNAMVSMVSELL